MSASEGRLMRELKIFGLFIVVVYFPYAYAMRFVGFGRKGHRNFFSHFPLVSTIIRVAWLLAIPLLCLWYFKVPVPYERLMYPLVAAVAGLTLSDTLHFAADMMPVRHQSRRQYYRR